MKHTFLMIALAVFVIWLLFVVVGHVIGWFIHLLWIVIILALAWWLFKAVFGGGRGRRGRRAA